MSVEGSMDGVPSTNEVLEDSINANGAAASGVGENGIDYTKSSTTNPEDNVQHTEASTHEEYETMEDGTRTKVRTSTSETKEVSHTIHRRVYGSGMDSQTFNLPEFPEISPPTRPYPDNAFFDVGPTVGFKQSPVRVTREYVPSTSEERVISTARLSQRNDQQPLSIPVKVTTLRSKVPGIPGQFISMQAYEDLKNTYQNEIERIKSSNLDVNLAKERETTKEILQRRVLILESDLKDSKHVSEMLSEDLQTLRKQYEDMVNRNLQTENNNRLLQQRLHEMKSVNKKMQRDASERGQLVDRLREAYNRERRTQRVLAEMEEEHTKLVRDYDVLRQSYNRKEQQIHEFSIERTELYRKLDILEYEKQQLERVLGRSKSQTALRGSEEISRTSRGYSESGSLRRSHFKASEHHREEGVFPVAPAFPNPPYPDSATQIVGDVGFRQEVQETEAKLTDAPVSPDNDTKTETEKGPDTAQESDPQSPTKPPETQPSQDDPDKHGYTTDGTLHSTEHEDDPTLAVPEEYCRTTTQKGSRNESMDDELYTYSYKSNVGDVRTRHGYRNTALRKTITRQGNRTISGSSLPPPPTFDARTETYRRAAYQRRPLSAYGFNVPIHQTSLETEIYRSPLPPRSSTSVGRLHPSDYMAHSVDRAEYTRVHRTPVRRAQFGGPLSPDPFKYEAARQTKEEIVHLEFVISKLKREKRRLEKELYAGQLGRSQSNELSDMLTRIGLEIYDLQSRLAILKTMR